MVKIFEQEGGHRKRDGEGGNRKKKKKGITCQKATLMTNVAIYLEYNKGHTYDHWV